MKDFFKTTTGRFLVSVAFAVGAVIVNKAVAFVADNPNYFTPTTVLFVNAVLFGVRNLLNRSVKNI